MGELLSASVLQLLQCPTCGGALSLGRQRHPDLECVCGSRYPFIDGIVDLTPRQKVATPGTYRTETLLDMIAGSYDVFAPAMSIGVWRCSPLRYVDSENRALGRGNGGVYLKSPIGTGVVLDNCLADYHDVTIICVDSSLKMLRKAQRKLRNHPQEVVYLKVDAAQMPLRDGVIDSAQSFNGIHAAEDRDAFLSELLRVVKPGGFVSGSSLVRSEEPIADALLDRLERHGVFPMMRSASYLIEELRRLECHKFHHSVHGAVVFFDLEKD